MNSHVSAPPESAPGGIPSPAARRLVESIEQRTNHLTRQAYWAARLLLAEAEQRSDAQPISAPRPALGALEYFARNWQDLVPDDPDIKADVAHLLGEAYLLPYACLPGLRGALNLDRPDVYATYQARYRQPLQSIFRADQLPPPELPLTDTDAPEQITDLEHIARGLEWIFLARGDVLFRQGDTEDSMFLLVSGRLRAVIERGEQETILGEIGPGETVGEMALLTGEDRLATVYALRDSEMVKLTKAQFDLLAEQYPRAVMQIARTLVTRLRRQSVRTGRIAANLTTVAVLPDGAGVPLAEFTARLAEAFCASGASLHLNSARLDEHLQPGAAQTPPEAAYSNQIAAWLSEQEARHHFVIYEADAGLTPWTRRCIRQADRILLLARGDSPPEPNAVYQELLEAGRRRATARYELVLLHADRSRRPAGTERWLAARPDAYRRHHVCLGASADYERLVRFLTGRAFGLALGGGGARGFAHIGVLRAMQEAGLSIDCIGGTSMGAVVAAQYALGWDYATIVEQNRRGWIDLQPMRDYTLPLVAILTGRKAVRALESMFGEARIEDLWTNFFCVSSNLTTGQVMVHHAGQLRRYLRASTSVPGITPPVPDEGSLLVDGAVLNNLPADVMRQMCDGGVVAAVNVTPLIDLETYADYGESLSAWQLLWSRANPFNRRKLSAPGIQAIMGRSMAVRRVQEAAALEEMADLYLHPPVDRFGLMELKDFDRIVEIGYTYTREKLAAWRPGQARSPSLPQARSAEDV